MGFGPDQHQFEFLLCSFSVCVCVFITCKSFNASLSCSKSHLPKRCSHHHLSRCNEMTQAERISAVPGTQQNLGSTLTLHFLEAESSTPTWLTPLLLSAGNELLRSSQGSCPICPLPTTIPRSKCHFF